MKKAARNSESVTSARWISFDRKEESGERNTDTKKESTRLTTCKLQGEGERKREKVACTLLGGSYIAGTACCKTQCATFCGGLRCLSAISRVNQLESMRNSLCEFKSVRVTARFEKRDVFEKNLKIRQMFFF